MLLAGLWKVHMLLALVVGALCNHNINDPHASPRVFISFKGKRQTSLVYFSPNHIPICLVFCASGFYVVSCIHAVLSSNSSVYRL